MGCLEDRSRLAEDYNLETLKTDILKCLLLFAFEASYTKMLPTGTLNRLLCFMFDQMHIKTMILLDNKNAKKTYAKTTS